MSILKKKHIPKIVVCKSNADLPFVRDEFISMLGLKVVGMKLCNIQEAIAEGLPLNQAREFDIKKLPHDVYLVKGVNELIPKDYIDPKIPVHLDSVKFKTDKAPDRNALCICGSGKKFKKCCIGKFK